MADLSNSPDVSLDGTETSIDDRSDSMSQNRGRKSRKNTTIINKS